MVMENIFYHIRWLLVDVTIFNLHVRNCIMGANDVWFLSCIYTFRITVDDLDYHRLPDIYSHWHVITISY